jgi:hypothetical protein
MRDRSWEERLPETLEALTLEELTYLSAHEAVVLGTSELSPEDLGAWLATLPPEGRERIMEVLRARVEASVWRQEVIEDVADNTRRMQDELLNELRRLLDDLRQ